MCISCLSNLYFHQLIKVTTLCMLQVLQLSKYFLLQTTSPDAIYRLQYTPLTDSLEEIQEIYFHKQHHSSIEDFLNHHMHSDESESGLLMQVNIRSITFHPFNTIRMESLQFIEKS